MLAVWGKTWIDTAQGWDLTPLAGSVAARKVRLAVSRLPFSRAGVFVRCVQSLLGLGVFLAGGRVCNRFGHRKVLVARSQAALRTMDRNV